MPTDRSFDPEEFLRRLDIGEFDSRVAQEFAELSAAQVGEVAVLMTKQIRDKDAF